MNTQIIKAGKYIASGSDNSVRVFDIEGNPDESAMLKIMENNYPTFIIIPKSDVQTDMLTFVGAVLPGEKSGVSMGGGVSIGDSLNIHVQVDVGSNLKELVGTPEKLNDTEYYIAIIYKYG